MKKLLTIFGLLLAVSAFGDPGSTNVTVRIIKVLAENNHTNVLLRCWVALDNQTSAPLSATNIYSQGLSLIVTDVSGQELSRAHAAPFKLEHFNVRTGSRTNETYYFIHVPDSTQVVKLRLEGTLPGSMYVDPLTSNVIELKLQ